MPKYLFMDQFEGFRPILFLDDKIGPNLYCRGVSGGEMSKNEISENNRSVLKRMGE